MVLGKWRKRKRQNFNYAYSAWDGTQTGFDISAEDLLAELGDDLLYDGDVNSALRRMMQSGFNVDGERVQGLQETLDRIRQERQERLENYDLGGVYEEVANELRDVIGKERESLDQLLEEARKSGDTRREEITQETVTNRNLLLDMIPPTLPDKSASCSNMTSPLRMPVNNLKTLWKNSANNSCSNILIKCRMKCRICSQKTCRGSKI